MAVAPMTRRVKAWTAPKCVEWNGVTADLQTAIAAGSSAAIAAGFMAKCTTRTELDNTVTLIYPKDPTSGATGACPQGYWLVWDLGSDLIRHISGPQLAIEYPATWAAS